MWCFVDKVANLVKIELAGYICKVGVMRIKIEKNGDNLEILLEIENNISINRVITPPDGEVSFVDILPEIYDLHTDILSATLNKNKDNNIFVKCDKGCATCCRQLVTISIHEALLLTYLVDQLNSAEKCRIKESFDIILSQLEQQNILKDLINYHVNAFKDKKSIISLQKKYWDLQLSCPFLVDNSCSIYPFRLLICREYLVSSSPEKCCRIFKNDHLIERIKLTHDFASAAASFDGVEDIATRGIPLPIIFLVEGLLTYFPRSKTTADRMLDLYLSYVENYFKK